MATPHTERAVPQRVIKLGSKGHAASSTSYELPPQRRSLNDCEPGSTLVGVTTIACASSSSSVSVWGATFGVDGGTLCRCVTEGGDEGQDAVGRETAES